MSTKIPFNSKLASSEDGFAIPIALGMGLIMILLATTAVVRSQNDRVIAVNKRFTTESLVAAETGITRVQDFLNRNRAAASVQACAVPFASTSSVPYGDCQDTSAVSWKVPGNIPNLCSFNTTDDTTLSKGNNWQNVLAGDDSKGKFRIVSYTTVMSGSDVTGGVLTVEGAINSGATNEARSRLQVTLPISNPKDELVASLWASETITGSPQIDSDYILGTTCTSTSVVTPPPSSNRLRIPTNQTMPAAMAKPTTAVTTPATAAVSNNSYYLLANISSNQELPRTSGTGGTGYSSNDQPGADGVYRYIVTSFNDSLKITPGKKVWLWVTGDIDLSNKIVVNQCGATGSSSTCGPFDVRVYPETPGTAKTLTLNKGTAVCDVFFHLPDYSVTFDNATGTASSQDCGVSSKTPSTDGSENTGIYWVKKWSNGLTDKTIIDAPRAKWSTALTSVTNAAGTALITTPPLSPQIGAASDWQTQSN
jgi:hypothetical protein